MKKISFLMNLMLSLLILCGCSKYSDSNVQTTEENTLTSSGSEQVETNVFDDESPILQPIAFNSIDDLLRGITNDITEDVICDIESKVQHNRAGVFRDFIENRREEKSVSIPFYKEKRIVLRDRGEGYSPIDLLQNEAYNLTWIWFSTRIENKDDVWDIKITYLDSIMSTDEIEESNKNGTEWTIKYITDGKIHGSYPSYEKELKLQDRTIKSLIKEDTDLSIVIVEFVYGDILVSVRGVPEILENGFFENLSFKEVPLK